MIMEMYLLLLTEIFFMDQSNVKYLPTCYRAILTVCSELDGHFAEHIVII